MSSMRHRENQAGEVNMLLVPLLLMSLLFVGAGVFGVWAYGGMQDYKLNFDKKVAAEVETARRDEGIKKDQAFAEAEKSPLTTYEGPDAYGSVKVAYPKTWSTYVRSTSTNNQPLDAYFNPRVVPSVDDQNSVYALRIQVVNQQYANVARTIESRVKGKEVTAAPFTFPRVPDVVGIRVNGKVKPDKKTTGSMIIMPLRDKTLQIWTESPEFVGDLDNIIIPNLMFSP